MLNRYISNFNSKDGTNFFDVIVIGSGISGIFTALNIDKDKKVLLISKSNLHDNNSSLAQGGVAVTINKKNIYKHIEDTLKAGSFYNDKNVVESIVADSSEIVDLFIKYGVPFDKDENGNLLFTKEGGHSERRIIHVRDKTGEIIINNLVNEVKLRDNIKVLDNCFVIDIITSDDVVNGIVALESFKKSIYFSNNVVLATGGIGNLYVNSTNSYISNGDGIAMARRAGAILSDMEFIQFHPTALDIAGENKFLISEAVRGEGGILYNFNGERFMESIHPLKELAPRDVVAKAIYFENKKGNSVFLDISHLDKEYVKNRFPKIYNHCLENGIDITKDLIPVAPVQHYFMGGIKTDINARTNIKNLYAVGECARTGFHGANRLASNSLLEGAVFGLRAAKDINNKDEKFKFKTKISVELNKSISLDEYLKFENEIKNIMSENAFIVRTKKGLFNAKLRLEKIYDYLKNYNCDDIKKCEVINMLIVSMEIVNFAYDRKESLGTHYIE